MATSEITEEIGEDDPSTINYEAQKERVRRIIANQKSLYFSSSSSLPSSAASCSCFASSQTSSSLLDLMKGGNASLKRLLEMQHAGLSTSFQVYSVSHMNKTIPLWGAETGEKIRDPWEEIRAIDLETVSHSESASGERFKSPEFELEKWKNKNMRRKLSRKRSSRRPPDFGFWRNRVFRFRLRLRRLGIMICGRIF